LTANSISDETREEIKEAIIALLGPLAAENFENALAEFRGMTVTPEELARRHAKVEEIKALQEARRNELRPLYKKAIPPLSKAEIQQKNIAAVTGEKAARDDLSFGEDMNRLAEAGRKIVFIYGEDYKTPEEAKEFVESTGYKGAITFVHKNGADRKGLSYSELVTASGVSAENIGIRAVKDEIAFTDMELAKIPGKFLEIQSITMNGQQIYVTMNSCEALLKMLLAAEGELPPIPGVLKDERGIYIYLPRMIPIDYDKEVKTYIEAIRAIRTAA